MCSSDLTAPCGGHRACLPIGAVGLSRACRDPRQGSEFWRRCRTLHGCGHLGREGHKNFWCGFCDTLIPQPDSSQQDSIQTSAWVLRFKHIGDHFDKENLHINDWVCIEHNKKKSLITVQDKKKAKTRFRDGKAADDSDLPDDGIPSKYVSQDSPTFAADEFERKVSTDMGMAASNKRKFEDVDDADADGVSDCD